MYSGIRRVVCIAHRFSLSLPLSACMQRHEQRQCEFEIDGVISRPQNSETQDHAAEYE
jgi:hypothetical protein